MLGIFELRPRIGALVLAMMIPLTAACHDKATLEKSRTHIVTVEGRKFEVRVTPTDVPNEYRMLVVRATLVVRPDAERERQRDSNVARQVMDKVCRGQPYQVLEENLVDNVNLQARFRCQA
jgi:hypothetical protein